MKDINGLRQKRAKLIDDARAILDKADKESRDTTAEDNQQYDRMMADVDKLKSEIDREERQQKIEAELAEVDRRKDKPIGATGPVTADPSQSGFAFEEKRNIALQGWLGFGKSKFKAEDRHYEAGKSVGIDITSKEIEVPLLSMRNVRAWIEKRALSVVTGSAGQFTVPEGFVARLEDSLLATGNMRVVAEVVRTESGNPMPWPTSNDTSNEGEILAENTSFGASTDPTFGQVVFDAYKYSSKPVMVPFELLQDSAFDMAGQIAMWLGARIGRIQQTHFTTGDGSSKPRGIITASNTGKTTASATAITADEIIDLQHSVDPEYRMGAAFMFHDNIFAAIRKLKGSDNNYLWQPGMQVGAADRLLGDPFFINQKMASAITTGLKTMIYGSLSKYKIRDVASIRMVRLNERYADLDQVAFIAFLRSDGDLIDAGTDPVKLLVQA